jgi:predicted nucleotidyltransferase
MREEVNRVIRRKWPRAFAKGIRRIPGDQEAGNEERRTCYQEPVFLAEALVRKKRGRRHSVIGERPEIPKEVVENFCRKHHIRKMSIFGSYLREDFGPESDIDFLVEFDPRHVPSLFDVVGMEIELSELLNGRKVDLRTPQDLSRYFRDEVVAEAEVQYAEG